MINTFIPPHEVINRFGHLIKGKGKISGLDFAKAILRSGLDCARFRENNASTAASVIYEIEVFPTRGYKSVTTLVVLGTTTSNSIITSFLIMGKLKIISDKSGTYEVGSAITQMDFLSKYFRTFPGDNHRGYYVRIPMTSAIDLIAEKLGVEYKYI